MNDMLRNNIPGYICLMSKFSPLFAQILPTVHKFSTDKKTFSMGKISRKVQVVEEAKSVLHYRSFVYSKQLADMICIVEIQFLKCDTKRVTPKDPQLPRCSTP
ncbi:hypothetical protein TNCT_122161 [Trichonephila clavata]|uniref:Uncharacterized protein n=1 Tax=Trichonephila clavata TaxID=2740835 RepID=A0A8X6LQY2_TRICU|nr:hypothetical protein TNCT_122161 [Trichonephila clavata]